MFEDSQEHLFLLVIVHRFTFTLQASLLKQRFILTIEKVLL